MKNLLLIVSLVIMLFSCDKGKNEGVPDKSEYFLKFKVGARTIEVVKKESELTLNRDEHKGPAYIYDSLEYPGMVPARSGVQILDTDEPLVSINILLNTAKVNTGTYEAMGRDITLSISLRDKKPNDTFGSEYRTDGFDGSNTPLTINITKSNDKYVEGSFNGSVHSLIQDERSLAWVSGIQNITGSFRVKKRI